MKFINCVLKKEIIFENKTKESIIKQIEDKSIEQIKDNLAKDFELTKVYDKSNSGQREYNFKNKVNKDLVVNILFDEIYNISQTVQYSDKLDKLPVLRNYLLNNGYNFIKKAYDTNVQGIEVAMYGYRKGNILVSIEVGGQEDYLIVFLINKDI